MRVVTTVLCIFLLAATLPNRGIMSDDKNTRFLDLFSDEERVDFYPTYGYMDGQNWVIPLKLYVYEPRGTLERTIVSLFQRLRDFTPEEREIFQSRLQAFAADSESREIVEFIFDRDPSSEMYLLRDSDGNPVRTNLNGVKEGEIRISAERAAELLEAQNSGDGWLTFSAVSDGHTGRGKIRLTEPEGLSVISDIDDTIKISELPAGSRIAARNAFFKEYAAAPGMTDLYKQWTHAAIHYVSGTPKQFYRPLSEFLLSDEAGFPQGTFHLRDVRKNLLSLTTWRDLENIISDENVTYNHKLEQFTGIIQHFPGRQFILVGDSGQHDPEIFREIDDQFPGQVQEMIIRDITNDRERNRQRLEGMTVIPAKTVEAGLSQFE